jgi:hypothetical protein
MGPAIRKRQWLRIRDVGEIANSIMYNRGRLSREHRNDGGTRAVASGGAVADDDTLVTEAASRLMAYCPFKWLDASLLHAP